MAASDMSIASLTRTSALSDLLQRLSEGQEIVWSRRVEGEPQIRVTGDEGEHGQNDLVLDPVTGRTSVSPRDMAIPFRATRALRKHPKSHAAFTNKRLSITQRLWSVVLSKAAQSGLAVRADVGVEEGVEDKSSQVVLAIHVQGNASQALALWKSLDADMDRWLARLPAYDRGVLMNDVGLRFSWVD